jgi:hypothetical protein
MGGKCAVVKTTTKAVTMDIKLDVQLPRPATAEDVDTGLAPATE